MKPILILFFALAFTACQLPQADIPKQKPIVINLQFKTYAFGPVVLVSYQQVQNKDGTWENEAVLSCEISASALFSGVSVSINGSTSVDPCYGDYPATDDFFLFEYVWQTPTQPVIPGSSFTITSATINFSDGSKEYFNAL